LDKQKNRDHLLKELDIAMENRAFELQLFWQRSNYFLVLITALGVGVIAIKDQLLVLLIAVFGAVVSFLWFRTNLGSRFWHESWEIEVTELSKKLGIESFKRPMDEIVEQVRVSLEDDTKKSCYRRWINRQTLAKPSVSRHMITLSLVSTVVWIITLFVLGFELISSFTGLI